MSLFTTIKSVIVERSSCEYVKNQTSMIAVVDLMQLWLDANCYSTMRFEVFCLLTVHILRPELLTPTFLEEIEKEKRKNKILINSLIQFNFQYKHSYKFPKKL